MSLAHKTSSISLSFRSASGLRGVILLLDAMRMNDTFSENETVCTYEHAEYAFLLELKHHQLALNIVLVQSKR